MSSDPMSILVVDDSDPLRRAMARTLRRAGYQTTEAQNGAEALRALEAAPFDLVLLDVVMPGMDGAATATAIRAVRPAARIVFVSGVGRDAATSGDAGFLGKPFTPDSLLVAVQGALAPRE